MLLAYFTKIMAAFWDEVMCVNFGIFGYLTIILGGKELIARSVSIPERFVKSCIVSQNVNLFPKTYSAKCNV